MAPTLTRMLPPCPTIHRLWTCSTESTIELSVSDLEFVADYFGSAIHRLLMRRLEPTIELSVSDLEFVADNFGLSAQPPPLPERAWPPPRLLHPPCEQNGAGNEVLKVGEDRGSELKTPTKDPLAKRISPHGGLSSCMHKRPVFVRRGITTALCAAITVMAFARPAGDRSVARPEPNTKAAHTSGMASAPRQTQSAVNVKPTVHGASGPQAKRAAAGSLSASADKAQHKSPRPDIGRTDER
jgi:hypothetical protein